MEENKTFKSKWNERDEICPACGNVTKEARGLAKQNLKKLFRKPTTQDWILFIIIVLTIFGAYAYQADIEKYQEIIRNPGELCSIYYSSVLHGNFGELELKDIKPEENETP